MNNWIIQPLFYLSVFCVTALISFIFTASSIPIAHRTGCLDFPDKIKLHGRPVPYLGGVAIFVSFWLVASVLSHILSHPEAFGSLVNNLPDQYLVDYGLLKPGFIKIFLGACIILVIGITDDRFVLKPVVKFIGQIAVALFLVNAGFEIQVFQGVGFLGKFVSLVWIITLINAFNFIDSIDGHCAGIVLIATGFLFSITQTIYQPLIGLILLAMGGAIFGFLPFNYDRARTFLGDNGSMFLGYMMAALSLQTRYQVSQPELMTLFVPLFVFGVPIYDLLSVVCVRLYRGAAPWKGDRNHFAHRLIRIGMDGHDAVLFSYIVAITTGLIAVLSTQVSSVKGNLMIVLLYCMILFIIAILEYHSVRHRDQMMGSNRKGGV